MKHTKVIDFDILYLFNKFKFYCYLSGLKPEILIQYCRKLDKNGDVAKESDKEYQNILTWYSDVVYPKPYLKQLLFNTLYSLLDYMAYDNTNCRYLINCINYKAKKNRLAIRIANITSAVDLPYKYFFTLTFKSEHLLKWEDSTRHQRVKEFLGNLNKPQLQRKSQYVCNVDYGSRKKRVHYHGVLATDIPYDELRNLFKYGRSQWLPLHEDENTSKIMAGYINKLVNHSYKSGTLSENVIYSRKRKEYK